MLNRELLRRAQHGRSRLLLAIAFNFVGGLAVIAQAWLLSTIIARVFLDAATLSAVAQPLAILLGMIVVRALLAGAGEATAGTAAIQIKSNMRRLLADHLLAVGPAALQNERSGELTAVAMEGIETFDAYLGQYLPQLASAVLIPLAIAIIVLPLDLLSFIVLVLTAPLIPLFMFLIGKSVAALTRRQFTLLNQLSAHFLDTLQGLATLKALNISRQQTATIRQVSERYAQATLDVLRLTFLSALVLEIAGTLSTAIIAVEVSLRLLYSQMGFQSALFILILAPEFYLPMRTLGLRFHAAAPAAAAMQRIAEVLAWPVPYQGAAHLVPASIQRIQFHDIRYTYPDGRMALDGASFDIPAGQIVALTGPSGAGKSTLVNLLLRFSDPTSGEILIDDVPLRDIDADVWRAHVAWVPQSPHLFHDTVAANIRFANPAARQDAVMHAAEQANLHAEIMALPQGYATVVGEDGTRLSGGQAQRLAIARAFLKDAPLLVLDEPSSSLDPESEMQLNEAIAHLVRGRTTLMIAHRLSTVAQADKVVVLADGRVSAQGTHAELAKIEGVYKQLLAAARGPR